jgi:hypothetical protein
MRWSTRLGRWILPFAWLFLAGCAWPQSQSGALPRFEDYPVTDFFTREPVAPKLVTAQDQSYADQIRDGVDRGYGVFRDGKEQKGPNFAGNLIVIQWGCGAPCLRMAAVDARTGEVHYPPLSFEGVGKPSLRLTASGARSIRRGESGGSVSAQQQLDGDPGDSKLKPAGPRFIHVLLPVESRRMDAPAQSSVHAINSSWFLTRFQP